VRKDSLNAALASAFVRWWTSKDVNSSLVRNGLSSARTDVLTDSALIARFPWFETTHINFQKAFLRPRHKQYRSASDELSKIFTRWIANQTTDAEAAANLHNALQRMDKLAMGRNAGREPY
jgi:ABC-type glycerol-3-phosphate transport system substrate-binding protein